MSMLAHAYNVIIDNGVGVTGHGREVVDGLNDTKKNSFNVDDKSATARCISL